MEILAFQYSRVYTHEGLNLKLSLWQTVEAQKDVRRPYFANIRPTHGGEALGLMRRLPFTPKIIPDTHFC
jgi:hypothetical protein